MSTIFFSGHYLHGLSPQFTDDFAGGLLFIRCRRPKPRLNVQTGFCWMGCLAVTYFRERKLTIIGVLLFHGPVREGKGWVQQAIAAKRNL